jgi:hypothetical protein
MAIKRDAKKFLTAVRPKSTATGRKPAIKMLDRQEIENLIREQAYKLFEQRGCSHGSDLEDWLQAERMVTKV